VKLLFHNEIYVHLIIFAEGKRKEKKVDLDKCLRWKKRKKKLFLKRKKSKARKNIFVAKKRSPKKEAGLCN
jgi:hypothetical protein